MVLSRFSSHGAVWLAAGVLLSVASWVNGSGAVGQQPDPQLARQAAERSIRWLADQQSDDGAWRSQTYGQMKTGAGTTALLALALSEWIAADDAALSDPFLLQRRQESIAVRDAALQFLLHYQSAGGHVRASGDRTDYPTYTTALTLLALQRGGDPSPTELSDQLPAKRRQMADYLIASQLTETGRYRYELSDLAYGGWDSTGGDDAIPPTFVQADIAITALVLQALAGEWSQAPDVTSDSQHSVAERAAVFLNRCRSAGLPRSGVATMKLADRAGGFWFTPEISDPRNKAGVVTATIDDAIAQSPAANSAEPYATATIDGVRAWLAIARISEAVPAESPEPYLRLDLQLRRAIKAGRGWLQRHPAIDAVPGFQTAEQQRLWGQGLRYYYWAGLAGLLDQFPAADRDRLAEQLTEQVLTLQTADGSWRNEANAMREDDPLIATAFSLLTLARTRAAIEGVLATGEVTE